MKRQWQCAAAALSACLAIVLYAKGFNADPSILLLLAATANGCAAVWILLRVRLLRAVKGSTQDSTQGPSAVRIDGEGAIWLREVPGVCHPLYVSDVLVVVKTPGRPVAIWRDALDPDGFRKVVVAARWCGRVEKSDMDTVGQKPT